MYIPLRYIAAQKLASRENYMLQEKLTPTRNKLYQKQFDILSFGASEYPNMIRFFKSEIFPKLPAKANFLDIGCGRGNYARPFTEEFDQTTIVDINTVFYDDIIKWAAENGRNLKGHNDDWLAVDTGKTQYDFVMMSHVLYYIPPEKRSYFILKGYYALKPGGYQIIVLNAEDCGIRDVYREFYTPERYQTMPYGEGIAAMLRKEGMYPHVEEKIFLEDFHVPTHQDMEMLIDFLLLREVPFQTEAQIAHRTDYINKNLIRDGKYVMDAASTIVMIHKPL
jgi:SAM-dependent methyltransferase